MVLPRSQFLMHQQVNRRSAIEQSRCLVDFEEAQAAVSSKSFGFTAKIVARPLSGRYKCAEMTDLCRARDPPRDYESLIAETFAGASRDRILLLAPVTETT